MTSRWPSLAAIESLAEITSFRREEEIYGQKDAAEHWYRVISGMARKCATTADGERQIVDFVLPGEFFGFTARNMHVFAVEAIVEGTIVASYPRGPAETLADANPELGRLIRAMAFETISRSQARLLILGRTTAQEKVGSFLVEMAERLSGAGKDAVVLPMSRYDIADYLALSVETVSRALTGLRQRGTIVLSGAHQVRIIDRGALQNGLDEVLHG